MYTCIWVRPFSWVCVTGFFSNGMHLKAISKAESSLKSYTRRYSEQFPLGASKPPIVPFVVYIVKGGFIKRHLH